LPSACLQGKRWAASGWLGGPGWEGVRNRLDGVVMSFLAELWSFMRVRKKFWLLPILIRMVLLGGLIVLTKGSAVAPFIYALF
jgi:Family of unknown function (DUF5989)